MNASEHAPFLRQAFELARLSRARGNHPFGAVLVRSGAVLAEGMNTVSADQDCTAHAEINLVRLLSKKYSPAELAESLIYCSTEPCPMCAGAIYWAGIGGIVFGVRAERLSGITMSRNRFSCRQTLENGSRRVTILGPLLEEEGLVPHEGFWN